jgi:hypothetical protein
MSDCPSKKIWIWNAVKFITHKRQITNFIQIKDWIHCAHGIYFFYSFSLKRLYCFEKY